MRSYKFSFGHGDHDQNQNTLGNNPGGKGTFGISFCIASGNFVYIFSFYLILPETNAKTIGLQTPIIRD